MRVSEKATQARRKESERARKLAEKEIKKVEDALKECMLEEEEACRKELSNKKRYLSEHEGESRRIRTDLKDGRWHGVNERSSKLWYSLNKMKMKGPLMLRFRYISIEQV